MNNPLSTKIQDFIFRTITRNNLIYNTSWEDSDIDRTLLQINNNSKILMITGAGCNAMNYLLDNPNHITCVDINPYQTALLELKILLIKNYNFNIFNDFFGLGYSNQYKNIYVNIRNEFSDESKVIWDKKINYFNPSNKYNFFYRGSSGRFARLIIKIIKSNKKLITLINEFLDSKNLQEQKLIYQKIEPYLWNKTLIFLLKRNSIQSMLGVPKVQANNFKDNNYFIQFLKENLHNTFTQIPIEDNYFWQLYFNGKYSKVCRPNYLIESNYNKLKNNIDNISFHTKKIDDFLINSKDKFTHFILLDHLDWLSNINTNFIEEEFKLILNNSENNAKVLFRSAAPNRDFIPKYILNKFNFSDNLTNSLHLNDKVGTYSSTHLGIIKSS